MSALTFAFSPMEDRLVLHVTATDGSPQNLALTRRLVARLIDGLAQVLSKTSPNASVAPEDLRDDIIHMEHLGALGKNFSTDAAAGAVPTSPQLAPTPLLLVGSVNVATLPTHFDLTVTAAGGVTARLRLSREDLHRVVEMLGRQAESAGWNLQIESSWLGFDDAALTVN